MSAIKRNLAILTGLIILLGIYFLPNIVGYYRYSALCKREGGLTVVRPLQSHVGWYSAKRGAVIQAAAFPQVAFVRVPNSNGQLVDYRYKGGLIWDEGSYEVSSVAETSPPVVYEINWINSPVTQEDRMYRSGYEIKESSSGGLMVRWNQFSYATFSQNRTLLSAPSWNTCYKDAEFFNSANVAQYFAK